MIPGSATFLAGLRFHARRRGLPARFEEPAIAEALAEAVSLAPAERDEPAALFFAFARRSRAFGGTAGRVVPFVVRSHAASLGIALNIDDLELEILRARVLLGAVEYEEIRIRFSRA